MRTSAAVVLLLLTAGCGAESAAPSAPDTTGAGWTRASDPPLAARYGTLLAWSGEEVWAFGGHDGPRCPDTADCPVLDDWTDDAAAYDPAHEEWRVLPAAPVDLDEWTPHVVADGALVVGDERAWWRFDGEVWSSLPAAGVPESARDGLVYSHEGPLVRVLDLVTGERTSLPRGERARPLRDGQVFATQAGVVLTGLDYDEPAPDEPTLTQADLWDGERWVRLPRTGMLGPLWHDTGSRLLGPSRGRLDGGEVDNWGRSYPLGGALDPVSGEWSELPDVPLPADDAWLLQAASGPLVATAGSVYDDRTGGWTPLGRPDAGIEHPSGAWMGEALLVVGEGRAWVRNQPGAPLV